MQTPSVTSWVLLAVQLVLLAASVSYVGAGELVAPSSSVATAAATRDRLLHEANFENHNRRQEQGQGQERERGPIAVADAKSHAARITISDSACAAACAASERARGRVDFWSAGGGDDGRAPVPPVRFCAGSLRLEACCRCIDEGFHDTGARNAFLHVCVPTTPRVLHGKDVDFLHIVLSSLEEQIRDQASSGVFAGVRTTSVCMRA